MREFCRVCEACSAALEQFKINTVRRLADVRPETKPKGCTWLLTGLKTLKTRLKWPNQVHALVWREPPEWNDDFRTTVQSDIGFQFLVHFHLGVRGLWKLDNVPAIAGVGGKSVLWIYYFITQFWDILAGINTQLSRSPMTPDQISEGCVKRIKAL